MPFPSATLSSTQYDKLRGTVSVNSSYRVRPYVSICPNTVAVAARVNGTPTGASFAGFAYDTVTDGAISNVEVGMTILVSRTDDMRAAFFTGRIRELPTGSTSGSILINETSAAIRDDDYVWILYDYRLWPVLSRDVIGYQVKDWDNVYAALPPVVSGIQTVYAGFVNPATGNLRIAFSASALAATSGASISSYAWTFGGVTTVISGATNTNTVTIDFEPSAGAWCKLVVTDSGGRTTTRRFIVFPHDATYPPATSIDEVSLEADVDSGYSGTMTAFDGFEDVLDNTLMCVWVDEAYNGTAGSLLAGTNDPRNIAFVGRIRTERNTSNTDEEAGIVADVQFGLEDTAAQLRRLHGALIAELDSASPTIFDEIANLTIWRGIVHLLAFHSTFLSLHDLTFDNTDNTYLCQGLRTQGENLFDVVVDLASAINAAPEFAPDGSVRVVRNPYYKTTVERDALLILANMDKRDRTSYTLTIDPVLKVGQVRSDGGMYINLGAFNQVYPLLALAPGVAQDYAEGKATLTRQVLTANTDIGTAKAELRRRIGRKFAEANIGVELTVNFMDGWRWLIPSRGYYFTHTIDADSNARGRAYTTDDRWLLKSISQSFGIAEGTCDTSGVFIPDINEDTLGADGDDLDYPEPDTTITPELPALPPFDPYPIPDDVVPTEPPPVDGDPFNPTPPPKNGNTVVVWDDDHVWVTRNYRDAVPAWIEVTPGSETVKACLFDPFPGATGLWILESDGTDSWVWYTSDPFASAPAWTQGDALAGEYTVLRSNDVTGGIEIYVPDGTIEETDTGDYDFTVGGVHGWEPYLGNQAQFTGAAWESVFIVDRDYLNLEKQFADTVNLTSVRIVGNNTSSNFIYVIFDIFTGGAWTTTSATTWPSLGLGPFDVTYDVSASYLNADATALRVLLISQGTYGAPDPFTETHIELTASQFPIPDGIVTGGSASALSDDYGATWDSVTLIGDSPGSIGGFDVQRVGSVSIAAADGQAHSATALGGAFSSLGSDGATTGSDPTLILIPWRRWGSTSNKNFSTSTPDYLLGSAAAVSGEVLWRVAGSGGRTAITPTGATSMPSPNSATTYLGTRAAVIASVSGTRHLFTSTNIGSGDTWTDRGALGSNADFIRPLRLSSTLRQLFWVDGDEAMFSDDYGVTIVSKPTPSAGPLRGIEVYG